MIKHIVMTYPYMTGWTSLLLYHFLYWAVSERVNKGKPKVLNPHSFAVMPLWFVVLITIVLWAIVVHVR